MSLIEWLVTPLGWVLRKKRAGDAKSIRHHRELLTSTDFILGSTSFADGGRIPKKQAGPGRGENISPELHWSKVPKGSEQFLLVMEDIDVPLALPILHVIALFDAGLKHLPEGALTTDNSQISYIPSRHGWVGYFGPRALSGHGIHHYWFHLYALDCKIPRERSFLSLDDLLPLLEGHVLAHARFEGIQKGK